MQLFIETESCVTYIQHDQPYTGSGESSMTMTFDKHNAVLQKLIKLVTCRFFKEPLH